MKKIIKVIIVLFSMFYTQEVYASDIHHGYSNAYVNECATEGTCLQLCGYTNKVRYTSNISGVEAKYNYFSSYIYYDFTDNSFFVEWLSQETDLKKAFHSYPIDKKYIFMSDKVKDNLLDFGICPKNSYIDTSGLASEVCFSNNDSYCLEVSTNNNGTDFAGDSTLIYNYEDRLKLYFENLQPEAKAIIDPDYDECEIIRNKTKNLEEKIVNHISEDFLKGYAIPDFLSNSEYYKSEIEQLKINYANYVEDVCIANINEDYENGNITEEEKDELIDQTNSGLEDLNIQFENAEEKIEIGQKTGSLNVDVNLDFGEASCNSILGDPDDTERKPPAYYLQFMFNLMKYIAILLLLALSIIEFSKAIAVSDQDAIKKALIITIKRIIIAVIIFFLPILIKFVLELFNIYGNCNIK